MCSLRRSRGSGEGDERGNGGLDDTGIGSKPTCGVLGVNFEGGACNLNGDDVVAE